MTQIRLQIRTMKSKTQKFTGEGQTIHGILKSTLVLFQIFGFMPVCGVLEPDASSVKFTWLSFRTLYSLLTIAGFTFLLGIQTLRFCVFQPVMVDIHRWWYFFKSVLISMYFFNLARHWPDFLKKWETLQKSMIGYDQLDNPKRKGQAVTIGIMILFIGKFKNYIHSIVKNQSFSKCFPYNNELLIKIV